MQTFIATLLLMGIVAAAMAVGVIFSNRSLRGSCGGTGKDCACSDEEQKECAFKKERDAQPDAS